MAEELSDEEIAARKQELIDYLNSPEARARYDKIREMVRNNDQDGLIALLLEKEE